MRVLALYDIHGNPDALEAVLADPRAADPDIVLVGGDAVPGPFARATLERLEAVRVPVRMLRGNGEREVAAAVGAPAPPGDDLAGVTAALTAAELGDERALALGELPLDARVRRRPVLPREPAPRRRDGHADLAAGPLGGGPRRRHRAARRRRPHPPGRRPPGRRACASSTPAASASPTRATAPRAGSGWRTGSPRSARRATTRPPPGERMLAAGWPDERSVRAALIDPVEPVRGHAHLRGDRAGPAGLTGRGIRPPHPLPSRAWIRCSPTSPRRSSCATSC